MKKHFSCVACVMWAFFAPLSLHANSQDHLEPEEGVFAEDESYLEYMFAVRKHLARENQSAESFRMVCLPSLSPEWSITIQKAEIKDGWEIELRAAQKQLWKAKSGEKVEIVLRRATVDAVTSRALGRIWRTMLERTKHSEPDLKGLVIDGVNYHFWLSQPQIRTLSGHCWNADERDNVGTINGKLVRICREIRRYAESPEDKRREALALITKHVAELEDALSVRQTTDAK